MVPLMETSKMPPLAESVSSKLTPTVRNRIFIAIHTFQSNGVKAAVSHYSERIVDKVIGKQGRPVDKPNICEERFTARASDHSVDQLAIQSDNAKWGLLYEPSRAEVLHTALRKISERLDNYTFIDLGAGKGLPLLSIALPPNGNSTRFTWKPNSPAQSCRIEVAARITSGPITSPGRTAMFQLGWLIPPRPRRLRQPPSPPRRA